MINRGSRGQQSVRSLQTNSCHLNQFVHTKKPPAAMPAKLTPSNGHGVTHASWSLPVEALHTSAKSSCSSELLNHLHAKQRLDLVSWSCIEVHVYMHKFVPARTNPGPKSDNSASRRNSNEKGADAYMMQTTRVLAFNRVEREGNLNISKCRASSRLFKNYRGNWARSCTIVDE